MPWFISISSPNGCYYKDIKVKLIRVLHWNTLKWIPITSIKWASRELHKGGGKSAFAPPLSEISISTDSRSSDNRFGWSDMFNKAFDLKFLRIYFADLDFRLWKPLRGERMKFRAIWWICSRLGCGLLVRIRVCLGITGAVYDLLECSWSSGVPCKRFSHQNRKLVYSNFIHYQTPSELRDRSIWSWRC